MNSPAIPETRVDAPQSVTGRRGFIATLGGFFAGSALLPLLPTSAAQREADETPASAELEPSCGNAFFD